MNKQAKVRIVILSSMLIGLFIYAVLIGVLKTYNDEDVRLVNSFVPKVFQPWLLQVERAFGYIVK